jgi:hypothetical protein
MICTRLWILCASFLPFSSTWNHCCGSWPVWLKCWILLSLWLMLLFLVRKFDVIKCWIDWLSDYCNQIRKLCVASVFPWYLRLRPFTVQLAVRIGPWCFAVAGWQWISRGGAGTLNGMYLVGTDFFFFWRPGYGTRNSNINCEMDSGIHLYAVYL